MRTVAITGVGAVTPVGIDATALIERWCAGGGDLRESAGRCREFEPHDHLTAKEARRLDRFAQLAVVAGDEAIAQAGWRDAPPLETDRVACIVGTGIGGIATIEQGQHTLATGEGVVSPLLIPRMMGNAAAAALAMRYGLRGRSGATVSACAAGADAVVAGAALIESGQAVAAVVGGAEAPLTPLVEAGFQAMGAMSKSGTCRPFDARRDGFVLGEGAAILVLEDEAAALERGARILGRLRGVGVSSDAHHIAAPDPTGTSARRAICDALADAERDARDVAYVNAHGTGTPLNDRAETEALRGALGEHAYDVPISSLKSTSGHLLGAAGAVEAVATLLALRAGVAPPTLGHELAEEGLDLDYVPGEARRLEPRGDTPVALSNSFGFGGHNVVLALEAAA